MRAFRLVPGFFLVIPFCAFPAAGAETPLSAPAPVAKQAVTADPRLDIAAFEAKERRLASQVSKAPKEVAALLELGRLKRARQDYAEAVRCFNQALDADPASLEAEILLSHALLDAGQYNQSLAMAERLIKDERHKRLAPALQAELYTTLGLSQGRKATAEGMVAMMRFGPAMRQNLERALERDPDYPLANLALGRFFLEAPAFAGRDTERGDRLVAKAVTLAPTDVMIRSQHLESLVALGRKAEAKAQVERYMSTFGTFAPALDALKPVVARLAQN